MSGAAGKRTSSKARSGLMSSLEEALNKEDLLNKELLAKSDTDTKLDMLVEAIKEVNGKFTMVHEIINEASDGIDPRTMDSEEKIQLLSDKNKQLHFELDILKGAFFKMESENSHLRTKVIALTAQSMKNNLTFGGLIANEENEQPIDTVYDFLTEKMVLDIPKTQILSARRIGFSNKPTIPRLMVAQLDPGLKELILSNLKVLKGKVNENKNSYSISKQLPDQWAEENRQLREAVGKARKVNELKKEDEQPDITEVKRGQLYINKVVQDIQPLSPQDRKSVHRQARTRQDGSYKIPNLNISGRKGK